MTKTFYRFEVEKKQVKLLTFEGTPTVNGFYIYRKNEYGYNKTKVYIPDREYNKKYAWPTLEKALNKFKQQMEGKQKIADNIIHIATMNKKEAIRLYKNAKQETIT